VSTVSSTPPTPAAAKKGPATPMGWWNNPWRKPRFLQAFTWGYLFWSLVPVFIAAMFSFNNGRSRSTWQGFSTQWYNGYPPGEAASVFHSPELVTALIQTLKLAVLTTAIAVPIGVIFAIGIDRWHTRTASTSNFTMLFSFVTPELILGVAMLFTFSKLLSLIVIGGTHVFQLGTEAQVLALIAFQMSYPVIIVRARLSSIGRQYEEAAMDLGARPTRAMWKVLLPLLYPAIFASAVLVFADVTDDFIIVRYLSQGAPTEPLSVKIYGGFRSSPTPVLNAMATIMMVGTLLCVGIGLLIYKATNKKRGGSTGSAVEDFAINI
jgi:spermidine/putrescine transport system permease protein